MSRIFDRLVEDPDFYVRVQKNKIILALVLFALALIFGWSGDEDFLSKMFVE